MGRILVKTDEKTLSTLEATKFAGVSRQTLYQWMAKKAFKVTRLTNGYVLIDKASFENFVEEIRKKKNPVD